MPHGRSDAEWKALVDAGEVFLKERAKKGLDTSYTEMNATLSRRTDQPEFDFSLGSERAALGHLLGDIVVRTLPESGAMLSSIVHFLNETHPGEGFYALAVEQGMLEPEASARRKDEFWIQQMNAIYAHYGAGR